MTWNSIMSIISSVALFLPMFMILIMRLGTYRSFPVLIFYYLLMLVFNLMDQGYIPASNGFTSYFGYACNFLDIPLMLYFLTYFSPSRTFFNRMKMVVLAYLAFEVIVIATTGYNAKAVTFVLGPGLVLIMGLAFYFFLRQVKVLVVHRKATGKALITSSIIFSYGSFSIVYILFYILKTHIDSKTGAIRQEYNDDIHLIYFFSTTLATLIMTAGIFFERKRIQKLNELKVTRKELSSIYSETNSGSKYSTVMLDFDHDSWRN
ncbi:MAG TPA: hypothetical protein P5158_03585 [Chitinophagaceae bacterium]|nr:hypothetical protein [Chitinophagaceae bacterium]MCB9054867.1 hypothetical protein [Chitinophagales bacterium]HRX93167.1 hypothetical protein [Chitinophagaceae bacterium]